MNVPYGTSPPEGYADGKQLTKVGRHVGLDFYDLLIEGDYTSVRFFFAFLESMSDVTTSIALWLDSREAYSSKKDAPYFFIMY